MLLTAGALDTTFGGTGEITTTVATFNDAGGDNHAYGVAIQPDLKTLVAGHISETVNGVNTHCNAVVRYNADGSLDTTFGSGGIVKLPGVAGGGSLALGTNGPQVQLQANGQIVVAGTVVITQGKGHHQTSTTELTVYRLNPNGSLDTTFNGIGQATLGYIAGSVAEESGLTIQGDGKIVVADTGVYSTTSGWSSLLVARLNADGTRDTTFGPNGQGYVDTALSSGAAPNSDSVTLDGSGNILVGGANYNPSLGALSPVVVRYTPAGLPDPTFGTNGEVFLDPPIQPYLTGEPVEGIGLQSNGQIIVSGNFGMAGGGDEVGGVARLNTDGSLDTSFGSGGYFIDSNLWNPRSAAIQPDDKILVDGAPVAQTPDAFVIDRITATGRSDTAFGTGGQTRVSFSGTTWAEPWAIAIGPDGKITACGGTSYPSGPDRFAVVRLLNDITSNTPTAASPASASATSASVPIILLALDGPGFWDTTHPLTKHRGSN
jgi:uncharacterized delta-60 repeat protein